MPTVVEEWPYVYVISNSQKSQYCNYCFNRASKLLRCSKCQFAHYCNQNCQTMAWVDHKNECDHLRRVHPKVPTDTVLLMARIIFKQKSEILTQTNERTFDHLMSHSKDIKEDILRNEHFAQICFVLNEFLPKEIIPSISELLEIFGKICINSFSICNDDMNPIGVGIYLKLSQLDHSCLPNCAVVFSGPKAILNSLEKETFSFDTNQLRISYIELLATTEERQIQLQSQYYFKCDCKKCDNLDFIILDSLMISFRCSNEDCDGVSVQNENQDFLSCQNCGKLNENFDEFNRLIQYFKWELEKLETLWKKNDFQMLYEKGLELLKLDKNYLSDFNVFRIRLLDRMFDACLELEKFYDALNFAQKTIKCYRKFYPENYPSVGLQLLKIGKLQLHLVRLTDAYSTLRQAEIALAVGFGTTHFVYNNGKELLFQCQEEMNCKNNLIRK